MTWQYPILESGEMFQRILQNGILIEARCSRGTFSRRKEGIVSFQVTFCGEKGSSLSCRLPLLPWGKGADLPGRFASLVLTRKLHSSWLRLHPGKGEAAISSGIKSRFGTMRFKGKWSHSGPVVFFFNNFYNIGSGFYQLLSFLIILFRGILVTLTSYRASH